MNLPPEFVALLSEQLDAAGIQQFQEAFTKPIPVSLRLHPNKMALLPHQVISHIPWHENGRYLATRPVFTLDPLLHAGAYYVQEASSMLLHHAISQHIDCTQDLRVLDLCAAPGGKSTLLATMLTPNSLLVCNEVIRTRLNILEHNMERWGPSNIAITCCETEELAKLHHFFDVMVVDAPCSGEGLFRKDAKAIKEWSTDSMLHCAARQKSILATAMDALRPSGLLIYSTCTYNRYENEANCQWLINQFGMEHLPIQVGNGWGFINLSLGVQAFPHHVQGEGFFLAAFRKPDGEAKLPNKKSGIAKYRRLTTTNKAQKAILQPWIKDTQLTTLAFTPSDKLRAYPTALEQEFIYLENNIKTIKIGTEAGNIKGQDFVPAHALAQSFLLHDDLPKVELDLHTALLLLKRADFALPDPSLHTKGWVCVTYQNLPLAWIKILPNRINNYLPQERRILMDIIY